MPSGSRSCGIPSVLLDREMPIGIDAVLTEHATGMRQADELPDRVGHRRIAMITAGSEIMPGRERMRGFVEAFASAASRA